MTTETVDATDTLLKQLEAQIVRLPAQAQLKLVARISERLSNISYEPLHRNRDKTVPSRGIRLKSAQREENVDKLLELCDAAASRWEGTFDSAEEIQQMRAERDAQIWPSTS